MRRSLTKFFLSFIFALAPVIATPLTGIANSSSLRGNDSVSWSQLGSPFTTFSGSIMASSADGVQVTVVSPSLERVNEGFGWIGIFPMNDQLLWNEDTSNPITLMFSTPVDAVGALVQGDFVGNFSVTLTAFDGTANLGSFIVNGDNTLAEDGSAPFLGVRVASSLITSVVFSEADPSGSNRFAVDTLEIGSSVVPEPTSVDLVLGASLFACAATVYVRRRSTRRRRSS